MRVLDAEGQQIGVMPTEEAIRRAEEAGLDLIEVAATAEPPVCRIADLGKFKFESDKRARDAKKNQHVSEVKEVRIRPRTDDHDLQVRVRAARRFLEEGHKVKVEVRFRGREATHPEVARDQMGASPRAWPISRSWNARRRWKVGRCSRFWRGLGAGAAQSRGWRPGRAGTAAAKPAAAPAPRSRSSASAPGNARGTRASDSASGTRPTHSAPAALQQAPAAARHRPRA